MDNPCVSGPRAESPTAAAPAYPHLGQGARAAVRRRGEVLKALDSRLVRAALAADSYDSGLDACVARLAHFVLQARSAASGEPRLLRWAESLRKVADKLRAHISAQSGDSKPPDSGHEAGTVPELTGCEQAGSLRDASRAALRRQAGRVAVLEQRLSELDKRFRGYLRRTIESMETLGRFLPFLEKHGAADPLMAEWAKEVATVLAQFRALLLQQGVELVPFSEDAVDDGLYEQDNPTPELEEGEELTTVVSMHCYRKGPAILVAGHFTLERAECPARPGVKGS
ncbi:MAG: hypothetical protein HY814_04240 [Candidatus Riflebacteria bacterium]|nr:hypothetical protein [Candidatus Riflebacteria bacterium]